MPCQVSDLFGVRRVLSASFKPLGDGAKKTDYGRAFGRLQRKTAAQMRSTTVRAQLVSMAMF